MALIPEVILDDIQSRLDIAEVIGGYIPLKRAGRNFKANCPFHREKTPSFMVSSDKQIFHCFGCGAGGNVFGFVMQQEHLAFPEAVRMLAERVGVEVPNAQAAGPAPKTDELHRANAFAAAYFQRMLDEADGAPVRAYLAKRGLTEACWRSFGLGYAPAGWEGLLRDARQQHVSQDRLADVGLIVRGAQGAWRDRFHQRLIFPIRDVRGRAIGFGARALDRSEPKYLNSPESLIYTKGRHLYGLDAAKGAIQQAGCAIVVEGYVDCIALHQQGFTHTVSPLGTALTAEQIRLLKRYTREAVMAFDADTAGAAAVIREMDLCLEEGLTVRVLQLPAGQDPDEYALREGAAAFDALVQSAKGLFDYKLEWLGTQHDLATLEGRVAACQAMLGTLLRVDNAVLQQGYVQRLAQALDLDERGIAIEMQKLARRNAHPAPASPPRAIAAAPAGAAAASSTERMVVGAMLSDNAVAQRVRERVGLDAIRHPVLRRLADAADAAVSRGETLSPAALISRMEEDSLGALVGELVAFAEPFLTQPQAIDDCLRRLEQEYLKARRAAVQMRMRAAQTHKNDTEVHALLQEYQTLLRGGG